MSKSKTFVAVVFLATILTQNTSTAQNSCTTPDSKEGKCVLLSSCNTLMQKTRTRPIPQEVKNLLRNSQCGFEDKQPKVCCPDISSSPFITTNLLPNTNQCGLNKNNKIVGGENTEVDEFPWLALIEYTRSPSNKKGFYCGGVLISSRYVLTAAHCVSANYIPKTLSLTGVRLGEHNTATDPDCIDVDDCNDPHVDIPVVKKIVHESYEPGSTAQQNDIALLRLETPVKFTDFIAPICLPVNDTMRAKSLNNLIFNAAGWGKTESGSVSEIKLKVRLPYVANNKCASMYQTTNIQIGAKQLCAGGENNKDTCQGDSGGPLMLMDEIDGVGSWYSMGIISFGPSPCGSPGWPGVYTRISSYMDWITKNLEL